MRAVRLPAKLRNEQRDTATQRFPTLANRAFVIEMMRLFRF